MATLAAALLLFPLSARGKKRGKRKPDASTVAASMQYHQRGTMAHVHGDIDGAKQAFREAIKLKPDFAYAYYRLAFVMHEQAQQERLRQQKEEGPNTIKTKSKHSETQHSTNTLIHSQSVS